MKLIRQITQIPGRGRSPSPPPRTGRLFRRAGAVSLAALLAVSCGWANTGRPDPRPGAPDGSTTNPDATGRDATGLEATGRDAADSDATGQDATGRSAADPDATDPDATDLGAGAPAGGRMRGAPLDEPLSGAPAGAEGGPAEQRAGSELTLGARQRVQASRAAAALDAYAQRLHRREQLRVAAARTWKVARTPLRPPPPPDRKPDVTSDADHLGEGLPPVLNRVPTRDRVVFLTIDDGHHKDPELIRMLRELDVPYSAFLSDYVAADDYDYFRRMQRAGAGIHNHTLTHKELPKLSYEGQRKEICGQQEVLAEEFGKPPKLFRPPYGAYNRDTLRAAATCGITAVPLWAEEAWAKRFDWRRADRKFHPGDIVLTHFRGREEWGGSMADMVRRTLKTATEQGFAVARLEDYL
ncbi:polysaccharide deacetylase family protein [Streptomyces sp. XM4193]|uniref:polysaccharide deacetylase family protein n=1 Tax=Streptomyces sp. XM4193 TaxID=2929782 RepID=UPI001FF9B1BE|nr:polysaccharide deacetylase family protein [Streptomyces sp. XM4193]MCK1795487.1 polysaccharide deacetylase family protein [Streptomyces sp. XM4193]